MGNKQRSTSLLKNVLKELHTVALCIMLSIFFCSLQKKVQPQVKLLAKAFFVKCALIQAAANTTAFMHAMVAVAFSSAVWDEDSSTGEQDADWT